MQKKLVFIWMFILLCVTIFIGIPYQNKKTEREFNLFYSSQLSGRIDKIEQYSRGSNFMLENNQNKYSFYPYIDKRLNNDEIFEYIAKPGDSIYKAAYSDTLFLIKGTKIYAYTFQKM